MSNNWTVCVLTIPSRDYHLRKLLDSISEIGYGGDVNVLYNCPRDKIGELSNRLSDDYCVRIEPYKSQTWGLPEARNYLLRGVKTPLVAFVDDDCTIEGGNVFSNLEETLANNSLGLAGLISFERDSEKLFKPRLTIPQHKIEKIIYCNVEGLLAATYTDLLKDLGGFNERKRFRGEWMDLNTKFMRTGYPTGIDTKAGFLRHWTDAPDSPSRKNEDYQEFIYFLMSTSVEFDCQSNRAENFWKRILQDNSIPTEGLLETVMRVVPRLLEDKEEILKYRDYLRSLPFNFMPLEIISSDSLTELIRGAEKRIEAYKTF